MTPSYGSIGELALRKTVRNNVTTSTERFARRARYISVLSCGLTNISDSVEPGGAVVTDAVIPDNWMTIPPRSPTLVDLPLELDDRHLDRFQALSKNFDIVALVDNDLLLSFYAPFVTIGERVLFVEPVG